MEKQIKYIKSLIITIAVLVCFGQALFGMAPPTLPGNFAQLPPYVQQEITSKLSDRDLARLAKTSRQASRVLEDELAQRQEKAAKERALWESRIEIYLRNQRRNYPSHVQFKQAVLNRLKETTQQHPGQWISLDLSNNNLGSVPSEDLTEFFQSIAKYNVVELFLYINQLTSLPENIFNGLPKLQRLNLSTNQLSTLPENIFKELYNLQRLDLDNNLLTSLPANIFNGLPKLQRLYLWNNLLTDTAKQSIRNALPNVKILF